MVSAHDRPFAPSSAPLAFTVENIDVCAFATDTNGIITAWNAAAERRFSMPAARALGARCCVLLRANGVTCCSRCPHRPGEAPPVEMATAAPTGGDGDVASCSLIDARVALLALPIRLAEQAVMLAHIVYPIQPALAATLAAAEGARAAVAAENGATAGALASSEPEPRHTPRLSQRERQTLCLLASGLGTSDIAFAMTISVETARKYIAQTLTKLGASTRVEATLIAHKLRLLDDEAPQNRPIKSKQGQ